MEVPQEHQSPLPPAWEWSGHALWWEGSQDCTAEKRNNGCVLHGKWQRRYITRVSPLLLKQRVRVWGGCHRGMEQPYPGASVLPCDGTLSEGAGQFFNYGFIKAVEKTIAVQGQRTLQVSS